MDQKIGYESKSSSYFGQIRSELLELIPEENRGGAMLELGCAGCATLDHAKKHGYASYVFGIDIYACDIDSDIRNSLDGIKIGDVQEMDFPFGDKRFDVILCPDVLEHLVDPYAVVRKLRGWLNRGGVLIVSLPNVNNWRVLRDLIFKDSFSYVDAGILDRTHLRFFAGADAKNLLLHNGFEITVFHANPGGGRARALMHWLWPIYRLLRRFLAYQYFVVAKQSRSDVVDG